MGEPLLSLEEARERILAAIEPLGREVIPVAEGFSRVAAEVARAAVDLPPFDNSSMDGYAVRASDLAAASEKTPVQLRVADRIPAGQGPRQALEPGTCARIFTGSMLPVGADAVVMQEDVRLETEKPGTAVFAESVPPWENVRFKGEDVKAGAPLSRDGSWLRAPQLGLLLAAGVGSIRVYRRPEAGFLATGDELRQPGEALLPGQIYESNRAMLAAIARARLGARPQIYPLVPDTLPGARAALEEAFGKCDVVVTTGGVSVGEMDFVKAAFEQLGGQIEFWKVAIRPGKPFVFGRRDGKCLFGLPGNPVSAFVTFLLLVCPALAKVAGVPDFRLPTKRAKLVDDLINAGDRRHFMRVRVEKKEARLSGPQASHRLGSLAQANGLVDVPPNTTLPAGTEVEVLYW